MRKNKVLQLLLVFAMIISSLSTGINATELSTKQEISTPALQALLKQVGDKLNDDDNVNIIVELNEGRGKLRSSLKSYSTMELMSAEGKQKQQVYAQKTQAVVKDEISKKNIDIDYIYSYAITLNGFGAKTTLKEAKRIALLPEVKSVEIAVDISAPKPPVKKDESKPSMYTSNDIVKSQKVWDLNYKGEGKIVAVLDSGADVEHQDWKVSDDRKVKLAEKTANAKIKEHNLKGKYISSKVPYAYNYYDDDHDIKDLNNGTGMHGMHVGGTVAANGEILGVAPEAQILVMRVFGKKVPTTNTVYYVKAIEDSLLLGADSINMSLGSAAGSLEQMPEMTTKAIQKARDLGVIVNIAAGNDGFFGQYWNNPSAKNPDFSVHGAPAVVTESLSVASFENTHVYTNYITVKDYKKDNKTVKLGFAVTRDAKLITDKPIEYIYIGLGRKEDVEKLDGTGKIALIERGAISFTEKLRNAESIGCEMGIVFNHEAGGDTYLGMQVEKDVIPSLSILRSHALELVKNNLGPITIHSDKMSIDSMNRGKMSAFSSWGPTPALRLKPELSAPGGQIYSTMNDGKYSLMSGTSMATPHVAGGVVILAERLEKDFPNLKGASKHDAIKNILMNTAKPNVDLKTKTFTSPRNQGAGIMDLEAAVKTNVIATHAGQNIAAASLLEKGDKFDFEIKLDNIGKEKVTYRAKLVVTTDQTALANEKNPNSRVITTHPFEIYNKDLGTITVEAGKSAYQKVSVDISEKSAELKKLMPNGFYVDGFVVFEDVTDKTPELSVPFLAFNNSWNNVPIIEKFMYDMNLGGGELPYYFDHQNRKVYDYTHLFTNVSKKNELAGRTEIVLGANYNFQPYNLSHDPSKLAFSPNGDNEADKIFLRAVFLRNFKELTTNIYKKGSAGKNELINTIYSTWNSYGAKNFWSGHPQRQKSYSAASWSWDGRDKDLKYVEDGEYIFEIDIQGQFKGSSSQKYQQTVKVDTKAPVVSKPSFDNKTGILTINAKDATSGIRLYKLSQVKEEELKIKVKKLTNPDEKDKEKHIYKEVDQVLKFPLLSGDGKFKLPVDANLENLEVLVQDYAFNDFEENVQNLIEGGDFGSLTVIRKPSKEGGRVPSARFKIVNLLNGREAKNISRLAYGKYEVTPIINDQAFTFEPKSIKFEVNAKNPNPTVTFTFTEDTTPKGSCVVVAKLPNGYTKEIQFKATNLKTNKSFILQKDASMADWYRAKLSYGDYKVEVVDPQEGFVVHPPVRFVTINSDKPSILRTTIVPKEFIGSIKPVTIGIDSKEVTYRAYSENEGWIEVRNLENIPFGRYEVFPAEVPAGYYVNEPYLLTTINDKEKEAKPEFIFKKDEGLRGSVSVKTLFEEGVTKDDAKNLKYVADDYYGKRYTDLTKLPYGTYFVKAVNLDDGTYAKPQYVQVKISDEKTKHEIEFTIGKLSKSGKTSTLFIWNNYNPLNYRKDFEYQIISSDGKTIDFTIKQSTRHRNSIQVPFDSYVIKPVNIQEGFEVKPKELKLNINEIYADANFDYVPKKDVVKPEEPVGEGQISITIYDSGYEGEINVELKDAKGKVYPTKFKKGAYSLVATAENIPFGKYTAEIKNLKGSWISLPATREITVNKYRKAARTNFSLRETFPQKIISKTKSGDVITDKIDYVAEYNKYGLKIVFTDLSKLPYMEDLVIKPVNLDKKYLSVEPKQARIRRFKTDKDTPLEFIYELKQTEANKKALITKLNNLKKLREDYFVKETFAKLKAAIKKADAIVANKKASQEEVDAILAELNKLELELKYIEITWYRLYTTYYKAYYKYAGQKSMYTEESFVALMNSLYSAQDVNKNRESKNEDRVKAYFEVKDAIKNLKSSADTAGTRAEIRTLLGNTFRYLSRKFSTQYTEKDRVLLRVYRKHRLALRNKKLTELELVAIRDELKKAYTEARKN